MTNSIRYYAATAPKAESRRILNRMADDAEQERAEMDAMPAWAKAVAIDTRIPVSVKVEHDGLMVESRTSKRSGRPIHTVHYADGATQYEGDLAKNYVAWNR